MGGLWQRLWFRLLAIALVSPPMIGAITLSIAATVAVVNRVKLSAATLVPPPGIMAAIIGIQIFPLIPFLIAAERGNLRRARALPFGLYALFTAIFAATFISVMFAMVAMGGSIPLPKTWVRGALALIGCYAAGCVISWALTSPLIRRWAQRNASAGDLAEHF